jgi:glycosyltransferase involved in cell wall biosynthesis
MVEVWLTVVAPLLEALRPSTVLDLGDDRVAALIGEALLPWEGRLLQLDDVSDGVADAADLALIHLEANWWTTTRALEAIAEAAKTADRPLPLIIVADAGPPWGRRDSYGEPERLPAEARRPYRPHGSIFAAIHEGTPRNGVLTAVEDFVAARAGLQQIVVAGLGGTAILVEDGLLVSASPRLADRLDDLRVGPTATRIIDAVDERRRAEQQLTHSGLQPQPGGVSETDLHELSQLRTRVRDLATQLALERAQRITAQANAGLRAPGAPPPGSRRVGRSRRARLTTLGREPGPAAIRAALEPERLLEGLGWAGPEHELALPVPADLRGILDPGAGRCIEVIAAEDALALRRTLCSVLDRAGEPVALSVVLPSRPADAVAELARMVALAEPRIAFTPGPIGRGEQLCAGDELPWGWPRTDAGSGLPAIVYLLPGIAREGSGGSHSIVQEARGLRALGASVHVCVSAAALATAERLYGAEDQLFKPYADPAGLALAVADADTVVATEHTSLQLLADLTRVAPQCNYLYYVQDYEPLFAELGSPRSDRALLSYRAVPEALLFAKTHWLRNVVAARHGTPVVKVDPSLDTELFNQRGRDDPGSCLRVLAMVRPRTPRRRPGATLAALAVIGNTLGDRAELVTFGCELSELEAAGLRIPPSVRHLGLLSRHAVADQLRSSDVFVDLSTYQAFGRSGLEAMACGAVPVLPSLGGVSEYASDGQDALVIDCETPLTAADAVIELATDRELLRRLRVAGVQSATRFTIERAARSQLALFKAAGALRELADASFPE